MTEIRDPEEYEAVTRRRASASDQGSILYRPREPRAARAHAGQVLTCVGNAKLGALQLSYVHDRIGTNVSFPEPHPLSLCLMTVLRGEVNFGGPGADATTTTAAGGLLLARVQPGERALTADGTERLNLWVNAQVVTRRLEDALQTTLRTPLVFAPEPAWPRGVGGTLRRLVGFVAGELADPYSSFAGGVGVPEFEDLVTRTLVDGATHNYTDQLARAAGPVSPQAVSRALAFMRENVGQTITVADVARAAGCSSRALSFEFRKHRGQTVTSALRDLKLDHARTVFARTGRDKKVADVAAGLGFSNTGRFAKQYQQRFGETPLQSRRLRARTRTLD